MKKLLVTLFIAVSSFLLMTGCSNSIQLINGACNTSADICGTVAYICNNTNLTPSACTIAAEICKYSQAICVAIQSPEPKISPTPDFDKVYSDLIEIQNTLTYYQMELESDKAANFEIVFNDALDDMKEVYFAVVDYRDGEPR